MSTRLHITIGRWLSAERAGRGRDAERALVRIFRALPMPSPSAGFADRVLAGAGLVPAAYPWWSRAAIAACVALAGLTLAFVLPVVFGLTRLVAPAELAGSLVRGFVAVLGRIDEALSIWQFFAAILDTLFLVLTAPPVLWTLVVLTALSAFTFRGLSELLSLPRSPVYAQTS